MVIVAVLLAALISPANSRSLVQFLGRNEPTPTLPPPTMTMSLAAATLFLLAPKCFIASSFESTARWTGWGHWLPVAMTYIQSS